jgi:hypothetical protein
MIPPTPALHKEVKAEKKISLTKIILLTDFSAVSDLALEYALAFARVMTRASISHTFYQRMSIN